MEISEKVGVNVLDFNVPNFKVKAYILVKGCEFKSGKYESLENFYKGVFVDNEYARNVFTCLNQQIEVPDEIYVIQTDDFGSTINTIVLTQFDQRKERVVFFTEP